MQTRSLPDRLADRIRSLRDDRRGAAAPLIGVSALVLVGMAGLATEVGYWYSIRRDAQNAADAAAIAGAARLSFATNSLNADDTGKRAQLTAAANDVARRTNDRIVGSTYTTQTGYVNNQNNNTVTVNWPPSQGAFAGSTGAVEVIITRNERRSISNLFLGGPNQPIAVRGVAALQTLGDACILATTHQLRIQGDTTLNAPECLIASNSTTERYPVNFNGVSYQLDVLFIASAGDCDRCDTATRTGTATPIPYATNMTTQNPYTWVDRVPLPSGLDPATACSGTGNTQGYISFTNGGTNPSWTFTNSTGTQETVSGPVYIVCNNWTIGQGNATETVTLPNGTYYFIGSNLTVNAGNTLQCCAGAALNAAGVSLVFWPDSSGNTGDVLFNGGSIVDLKAPGTLANNTPYEGILIYRRGGTSNQERSPVNNAVQINGNNASTRLDGGIYAPNGEIEYTGNANIAAGGCLIVVGAEVVLSGNATTASTNCNSLNPNLVNFIQIARLVE